MDRPGCRYTVGPTLDFGVNSEHSCNDFGVEHKRFSIPLWKKTICGVQNIFFSKTDHHFQRRNVPKIGAREQKNYQGVRLGLVSNITGPFCPRFFFKSEARRVLFTAKFRHFIPDIDKSHQRLS